MFKMENLRVQNVELFKRHEGLMSLRVFGKRTCCKKIEKNEKANQRKRKKKKREEKNEKRERKKEE